MGEFARVKIDKAAPYDLFGTAVSEEDLTETTQAKDVALSVSR
jgi:hypothetical protein